MFTKLAGAVAATMILAGSADAAFVRGVIGFDGTATLDDAVLLNATGVTAWNNTVVGGVVTGDFDTFINPGDAATFTAPWSFNSGAVTPLWTVGGFSFDLSSSSVVSNDGSFLNVVGTGLISGNGFDPTSGTWRFTTQEPSDQVRFTFSASTEAVPDGGTTLALLGVSLLGLGQLRRKLTQR